MSSAEKYARLVRATAYRIYRQREMLRASLELDDLEQELWIVLLRAEKMFNPDLGFAFSTYFTRAALNFASNFEAKQRVRAGVNMPLYEWEDEDGLSAVSRISSESELAEDVVAANDFQQNILKSADPRMAVVMSLLHTEPEVIAREGRALDAKSEYARSMGVEREVGAGVGLPDLFHLIGVSRSQGYRMVAELKKQVEILDE